MEIHILRLSHRAERDKRVTTHLGLVGRAFGAEKILIGGQRDPHLAESLMKIVERWGGDFSAEFVKSWRSTLKEYKENGWVIAHLTMYGMPVRETAPKVAKKAGPDGKVLIVVGGEKVPFEVYESSDFNVAVTSQPHSEISALAVFLDRLQNGLEFDKDFPDAKIAIKPCQQGKDILTP